MYESPSICGNKMENMIDLVPRLLRLTAEQELPIRERAMPYNKLYGRGHRAEAARAHRKHCCLRLAGWRCLSGRSVI